MNEVEIFYPTSPDDWRKWLEKNHLSKQSVWLVFYSKLSERPTVSWREAVDVALCFGWIDSKKIKIDKETSHQFFSKRKPNSTWSKINKEKVRQFIESGQMRQAGLDSIEIAKQNGSWTVLDEVEELIIPDDLEKAFKQYEGAKAYFLSSSKSIKKMMLSWIVFAKRPETRQKRIDEIAVLASQNKRPKQF
ncbi:YdeI/OmpD-associated family protein [Sphingobacterium sp. LRF_L2]|uniref:YdeI/OmpD-associated family protein n=1 Tax=Sphingobacterium sp. LRF_L2 TaxID=3369421 RepID=UPI003F5FD328